MDAIDRKVCDVVQHDGRATSAQIAAAAGVSVSTANERLRRLTAAGTVTAWRGVLDPNRVGAGLCGFMLIDMRHDGEQEATRALAARPEVLELHHVSGPYSYLAKVRLADTRAMQRFLQDVVKPLAAVQRTETIFTLETVKETTAVRIRSDEEAG